MTHSTIGLSYSISIRENRIIGNRTRQRRDDDKTVLGPGFIYTKDRLENLISASSGQNTLTQLLDDDVKTFWESDNKSDNNPLLTIDFGKDVMMNYVDLWPVLLANEVPQDAYPMICINFQKAW